MIHIQSMGGGLGNQLFVYAAARAIQLETGESIVVYDRPTDESLSHTKRTVEEMISPQADICYVEESCRKRLYHRKFPVRTFIFRISHKIARLIFHTKTPVERLQLERMMQPLWNRLGFAVATLGYVPICRHRTPKNYVMFGYFCSGKFYGTHSDELCQELCRPDLIPEKSQTLLRQIQSCNSVCLHIRFGDYVDPQKHFREMFYVCGPEYYMTAMKKVEESLKDPTFFVFTNKENVVFIPDGNSAVGWGSASIFSFQTTLSAGGLSFWGTMKRNISMDRPVGPGTLPLILDWLKKLGLRYMLRSLKLNRKEHPERVLLQKDYLRIRM